MVVQIQLVARRELGDAGRKHVDAVRSPEKSSFQCRRAAVPDGSTPSQFSHGTAFVSTLTAIGEAPLWLLQRLTERPVQPIRWSRSITSGCVIVRAVFCFAIARVWRLRPRLRFILLEQHLSRNVPLQVAGMARAVMPNSPTETSPSVPVCQGSTPVCRFVLIGNTEPAARFGGRLFPEVHNPLPTSEPKSLPEWP